MGNRDLFLKELPALPSLTDSSIFPVSDGTTNPTYKTTMADIKTEIETSPFSAPLVITNETAGASSVGTITITGSTGAAVLSSTTDYDNLEADDYVYFDIPGEGNLTTYVISKDGFPNITVVRTQRNIPASSFGYGVQTILTKTSGGITSNGLSTRGVVTRGSVLSAQGFSTYGKVYTDKGVESNGPINAAGTISTTSGNDITSGNNITSTGSITVGTVTKTDNITSKTGSPYNQVNLNDGLPIYPYKTSFLAKPSTSQTILTGSYQKINFNVVNGSDTEAITHNRAPSGKTIYDTTNNVFVVPYDGTYVPLSYTIACTVTAEFNQGATPGNFYTSVRLLGTSTANGTSGSYLGFQRIQHYKTQAIFTSSLSMSITMQLTPATIANHRYISVWMYHTTASAAVVTGNSITTFSGISNG
jgi:hypothetical protein